MKEYSERAVNSCFMKICGCMNCVNIMFLMDVKGDILPTAKLSTSLQALHLS